MPVGVPDTEVYAAADAVLARGERPTVERVRVELGRGSPARVGKLLETWWDALAKRLAGETRLPALPPDVATAFTAAWSAACTAADVAARAALDAEQHALGEQRRQLDAERAAIEQAVARAAREAEQAERRAATADQRLADLGERLADQARQLEDLKATLTAAQTREATLVSTGERVRTEHIQAERAWHLERDRLQAHVRVTEDRAHAEVDRAREEAKRLSQQIAEQSRAHAGASDAQRRRLEEAQAALHAAQQALAAATAREQTLAAQLARMDGLPAALLAAQAAVDERDRRLSTIEQRRTPASATRRLANPKKGRRKQPS